MVSPMPTVLRPARPDDFDFCARLYFSGMAETIRLLKLDMAAQTANLRERWDVAEVEIITSDGADVGWLQKSIQDDALYLEQIFIDAASQNRGIGSGIINRLIDKAKQDGRPVTLGVRAAHAMSKRNLEMAFGCYLFIVGSRFVVSLL